MILKIKAHGKINLTLDVLGKRNDGYHEVAMLMQHVALFDTVVVNKNDTGDITVTCNHPDVPDNHENLAYRACVEMCNAFDLACGFDITIDKQIPIAGGMAGGSADAAAVIKAINAVCDLELPLSRMMEIGLKLGADIPFCIQEKPAFATGIGEKISTIRGLSSDCWILLVNPNCKISTKTVYEQIDHHLAYGMVDNRACVEALAAGNVTLATKYMKNVMQLVTAELCPDIDDVIENLKQIGALHAMMSGSGATCFGIFTQMPNIEKAKALFPDYYVSLTKPISNFV